MASWVPWPDHATPAGSLTERQPAPDGYGTTFDGKARHAQHGSASGGMLQCFAATTGPSVLKKCMVQYDIRAIEPEADSLLH